MQVVKVQAKVNAHVNAQLHAQVHASAHAALPRRKLRVVVGRARINRTADCSVAEGAAQGRSRAFSAGATLLRLPADGNFKPRRCVPG